MNINFIASRALTPIYPIIQVDLFFYTGQTNVLGTVTSSYIGPTTVDANIQFSGFGRGNFKVAEKLTHIHGYNETSVYRDFWINLEQLSGLNRNISNGGDYLVFEDLKYKIVAVDEKYRVGWILLTCAQGELTDV